MLFLSVSLLLIHTNTHRHMHTGTALGTSNTQMLIAFFLPGTLSKLQKQQQPMFLQTEEAP